MGYARVSTDKQDLTAQHDGLTALGVVPERIYVDHGLTGDRGTPCRPRAVRDNGDHGGAPRGPAPRRAA
ncbi:MAG: recombinase family protein [Pseudonocardiaceae bacterium]